MASAKQKLQAVLDRLEEYYGAASHVVKSRDPVDQIIYHLVSDGSGRERSRRAYRRLVDRFVNWNEARVALANEIRLAIEPVGKASKLRAEVVHAFLHGLFARRHTMDMPYLEAMSPEEAVAYLVKFSGVDAGMAAMALCLVQEEPLVLPSTAIIRVAQRVGILTKGATGEKARLSLTKAVDASDRFRLHRLLMRLGEEICKSRSFPCSRCPLAVMCRTGKKNAPGAEPPAKTSTRDRLEIVRAAPEKMPVPEEEPAPEPKETTEEAQKTDQAVATLTGEDDGKAATARVRPTRKKAPARKKVEPRSRRESPGMKKALARAKSAAKKKSPAKKKSSARKKALPKKTAARKPKKGARKKK